ncbi:glycosyltransferase [Hyphomonas sp.]|uniref:glycosyltransferase n=1 Tax=Hyphomonas sp. TaxID=87 RepID=UPI00391C9C5D
MIVILSTLNGQGRIGEMLDAVHRLRIPAGTTFHIVDNFSEDGTIDVVKHHAERLPIVLHSHATRGKNNCLNYVLNKLVDHLDPEELVVFTDDDILPSPGWLEEIAAAAQAHPECSVFAGRILPHWPSCGVEHLEPVRDYFDVLFTLTSHAEGPIDCALAWGPNMAIRASVFQAGYRYDGRFGPNGTLGYPMGSETELMERLDKAGYKAWFAECAVVRHMVREAQTEPAAVIQRAFRHGYGAGWRRQRGEGWLRLVFSGWEAFRGVASARVRRLWSGPRKCLKQDYCETWARGFYFGALYEYRASRQAFRQEEDFPERREEIRSQLSD